MPLDFNQRADWERDKRLRRRLLQMLYLARSESPTGFLGATMLVDLVNSPLPSDQRTKDDRHAIGLLRDLVHKQLATEELVGLRRSDELALKHLKYRITAAGSGLMLETRPADPDIDDERNLPE